MKKLPLCMSLGLFLLFTASLSAKNKPLDIKDIESWRKITEMVVSPNGQWIAYKTTPWVGDSQVHLCDKQGEQKLQWACGTDLKITRDSTYFLFTVKPRAKHVKILKLKKVKPEDMPKDALVVYNIHTGKSTWIKDIKSYKIPTHWTGWLAYRQETAFSRRGQTLRLKSLTGDEVHSWPRVTEYHFASKAKRLFFVTNGDGEKLQPGLYLYDLEAKKLSPIVLGANDYRQIVISENGDRLAMLLKPKKQDKPKDFSLYLWDGQGQAKQIVNNHRQEIPATWRISENGRVRFSENGRRIFFGIAPIRPERDPITLDEEYPDVDVWHWNEGLLHTIQLVNRQRELRRTYLTMYEPERNTLTRIETEAIPRATLLQGGDADVVLLYSEKPYELQSMWDPMRRDVYLLDLATGKLQTVIRGVRYRPKASPGGKYLLWYSYADASYHTYDIASGKTYRITRPETIRADEEGNTTFDSNAPYGTPGWLSGDTAVLVYDRYDIWKVDPQNRKKPENLTVSGRNGQTVYRLLRLDRTKEAWSEEAPQYLTGFNRRTRVSGYYRCSLKEAATPRKLIAGPYRLTSRPIKAAGADTVVYTKETFETFPDLIASDLTFRKSRRISDANPQQADFRWGTAELHRWTSLDGQPLEGILYKPADFDPSKKYPMIVQFFHKSSDQLYYHRTPEFHRSRIDYHYFVSNGYLVFNPDIYFDPGYIGESAYKSIMPGVTSLVDKGFVDPKRIGIQGHSYSGYQIAYLATRTKMFAGIAMGAPVANFFSAYGGIRWQTGRSRAAQYEHDQTLGTIWEVPLRFFENSPIFAMDKVTTPILILHNDHDGAVPWTQGIELFIALRRLQKPAWLLNYNNEGHCLTKLKNKKDYQIRLSQFFAHYLKNAPMPAWMSQGVPAVEKHHNLGYEAKPPK